MIKPIEIKPALNGYIVTVGCSTVVFDSRKKLIKELRRYLKDPEQVEKEYLTTALNRCPAAPTPTPYADGPMPPNPHAMGRPDVNVIPEWR